MLWTVLAILGGVILLGAVAAAVAGVLALAYFSAEVQRTREEEQGEQW